MRRAGRGTGTRFPVINLANVFLASIRFLVEIRLLNAFKMTYFSLLARILLLCCYCWTFLLLLIVLLLRFFVLWQMTGPVVFEHGTPVSTHMLTVTIKHCILRDLFSEALKRV